MYATLKHHCCLIILIIISLAVTAPVTASEISSPDSNFYEENKAEEHVKRVTESYDQAYQKLTKEQQAYLDALDEELIAILGPDIKSVTVKGILMGCLSTDELIAKNKAVYEEAFLNMMTARRKDKAAAMAKLRAKRRQVDFIDPALLQDHVSTLTMKIYNEMANKVQFSSQSMSCDQLRRFLGDYLMSVPEDTPANNTEDSTRQ